MMIFPGIFTLQDNPPSFAGIYHRETFLSWSLSVLVSFSHPSLSHPSKEGSLQALFLLCTSDKSAPSATAAERQRSSGILPPARAHGEGHRQTSSYTECGSCCANPAPQPIHWARPAWVPCLSLTHFESDCLPSSVC